MIIQGLRETPVDTRDYSLAAIIKLPKLEELPETFILQTLGVKDQGDSDFCAGFSFTTLSEMQEGVELSPEYQFALGKLLSGDPEEWGLDLRTVLKSGTKYGSLPQREAPYSLKEKSADFLRYFINWPAHLVGFAAYHKKKTFWTVDGPYDAYDNIRAAIWKFKSEKRGVLSGVKWSWGIAEVILTGVEDGGGHAVPYLGWNKDGIVLQNSAGLEAGIEGIHYVSRETINHFVKKFGAYMVIDLSPEEAEYYLRNGIKLEDNWAEAFLKQSGNFFVWLLGFLKIK